MTSNNLGIVVEDYTPLELDRGKRLENGRYHHNRVLATPKLVTKLEAQTDKWFKAYELQDITNLNRQFNRLSKSYAELTKTDLDDAIQQQLTSLKVNIERKLGRM